MKYLILLITLLFLTGCFIPKDEEEWVTVRQDHNDIKTDPSRPEHPDPFIVDDGFGGTVFLKGEEDEVD